MANDAFFPGDGYILSAPETWKGPVQFRSKSVLPIPISPELRDVLSRPSASWIRQTLLDSNVAGYLGLYAVEDHRESTGDLLICTVALPNLLHDIIAKRSKKIGGLVKLPLREIQTLQEVMRLIREGCADQVAAEMGGSALVTPMDYRKPLWDKENHMIAIEAAHYARS